MPGFVHLHLHSEYSLLDGACRISEIPRIAKEAGQTAVAITDHGVLYGAVAFYRACLACGIRPIIGCEVYVAPRTRFDRTHELDAEAFHLVLLVKNEIGYHNLITMVSKGFTEGFYSKPRVDMDLLAAHSEGLIALSGCLGGRIPQYIVSDDYENAEAYARRLLEIFGAGNFYLELQQHGLALQTKVNHGLVALSEKLGIPLVATNDVHYLRRSDADVQAVLMCIQTNRTMAEGRPFGFETDEFYLKTEEEMRTLFASHPEAIDNTVVIAEQCHFDFNFDKLYLPRFLPDDGSDPKKYLSRLAYEGLDARISSGDIVPDETHPYDEYKCRVIYELMMISRMGYDEYYLIVWDFVRYAKSHGIPVGPGRGSGAGSLVAYLLSITDVDPIRYNLLFERFLNPERVSMPDFDIDFCYNRRDEVIDYVTRRYGADHVSQIITFGTLAPRAAVRDVGRALGMPYAEVDHVAKLIPQHLNITLSEALRESEELKSMYDRNASVRSLIDISLAVEGMPRHASTHAAGVVITDQPLTEYVPLAVSSGTAVTQFDMDTIASLGLLKFDFLALRYLTIIADTEKMVREAEPTFEMAHVPLDDAQTYDLISRGDTDGVFQLESPGMKRMLTAFCPRSIEDIMIAIALYRPGPMESIPKFLENRRHPDAITYPIEVLADILGETSGCIVYQEQVMQICRRVANYSYGKADVIRRAMAKKKADVMEGEREAFLRGAKSNYIDEAAAAALYDEMAGFASYAFNKSHAAAYSFTSYRTAYLKCHYPRQYFAALLTSVLGNLSKMGEYIAECNRLGISVLPPDINESGVTFNVSGEHIRFGLLALKNVGQAFVQRIIDEREKKMFSSFEDFIDRMSGGELNKRQIETLIKAGAFDGLGVYRSRLLAGYEELIDRANQRQHKGLTGQMGLFDDEVTENRFCYPSIPELTLRDKIMQEKECSGLCFSGHISDEYTTHAAALGAIPIAAVLQMGREESIDAEGEKDGTTVVTSGILSRRVVKQTKKGSNMAFITLEDRYGEIEVVLFPRVLEKYAPYLTQENALAVRGKLSLREEEAPKLLADELLPMLTDRECILRTPPLFGRSESSAGQRQPVAVSPQRIASETDATHAVHKLFLRLPALSGPLYQQITGILGIFEGNTPVVYYDLSTGSYVFARLQVEASPFVLGQLRALLGEENVVTR